MYPLGKCYILCYCLFLWASHRPLFLALMNVLMFDMSLFSVIGLPCKQRQVIHFRGSAAHVFFSHTQIFPSTVMQSHQFAAIGYPQQPRLTRRYELYMLLITETWLEGWLCVNLLTLHLTVPKRWAIIAGTFLKLTCDPCKQAERVRFPNVDLFSLSLLFPLFLYLERNGNPKNSLSRGQRMEFLSLYHPPTCNSLWPWTKKAQNQSLPLFCDLDTEFMGPSH